MTKAFTEKSGTLPVKISKMMAMKTAVKSVGLALVAALTCGCAGSPSNEPYVQRVSLTRPELLGGETIRTFSGVVRAAHEVNLGFKTAGQIARIHVEEGDYVRRTCRSNGE